MYEKGLGVPADDVQAYMWATLAAAQNDPKATVRLSPLEKSMTPDQIAEAKRRVAEWKPVPETKPDSYTK